MFLGVHYSDMHYFPKTNLPKQQLVHVQVHVYLWQGLKPISDVFFNCSPCYISESLLKPMALGSSSLHLPIVCTHCCAQLFTWLQGVQTPVLMLTQ